MKATWYVLRVEKPKAELRVLVIDGRIAANSWHISLTGDPWPAFLKEKTDQGWKVSVLGTRVI